MTACVTILFILLQGGCASNAAKDVAGDDHAARVPAVRCPAGYTMVCEAKKVGRIRFGRMGNDNLDSCSCEPESRDFRFAKAPLASKFAPGEFVIFSEINVSPHHTNPVD
jgi:hypothetical protein